MASEGVVCRKINKFTGTRNDVVSRVKRDLNNWHYNRDITHIYIGITSAVSNSESTVYEAMKSRMDARKREWGINEMVLLYLTRSEHNIIEAEKEIIAHNMEQGDKAVNYNAGGGGRAGALKEWHVLYAALARRN